MMRNRILNYRTYLAAAALAAIFVAQAYAQEAGTPGETPATASKQRSKYRKSRLTRDESEAKADHRKLVLAKGEDKAVDLDFEANAGAQGIAVAKPDVV